MSRARSPMPRSRSRMAAISRARSRFTPARRRLPNNGQFVEGNAEAFLARQGLVLPPFGVGVVLLHQKRAGRLDRLLAAVGDVELERDRPLRGHRLVGLGERLLVTLPLPFD